MSQVWNLDASHTSLSFSVRHMMISTVRGSLKLQGGHVTTDDTGKLESIEATVDVTSINTADGQRDGHLNSPDFFDSASHPTMTFKSTSITPKGANEYTVTGDLTIRGTTKPVTLEVETTETAKDPWGQTKIAATATGKINRKDWGLVWNQVLETGGMLVSEEVKLTLDVQAVQATPAAA
jgi:polyisoprenoid-binding protein YceI